MLGKCLHRNHICLRCIDLLFFVLLSKMAVFLRDPLEIAGQLQALRPRIGRGRFLVSSLTRPVFPDDASVGYMDVQTRATDGQVWYFTYVEAPVAQPIGRDQARTLIGVEGDARVEFMGLTRDQVGALFADTEHAVHGRIDWRSARRVPGAVPIVARLEEQNTALNTALAGRAEDKRAYEATERTLRAEVERAEASVANLSSELAIQKAEYDEVKQALDQTLERSALTERTLRAEIATLRAELARASSVAPVLPVVPLAPLRVGDVRPPDIDWVDVPLATAFNRRGDGGWVHNSKYACGDGTSSCKECSVAKGHLVCHDVKYFNSNGRNADGTQDYKPSCKWRELQRKQAARS